MDRIKQVYSTLSKAEIKGLKNFLAMIHTKGENKPLELIQIIERKPGISVEQASEKLYSDPKSKAFIMMKARLYDRMLDFLSFLADNDAQPLEERYFENQIRCRKAMLHAMVLRDRRLPHQAVPFLQEAAHLARKCIAPEWELDALNQLRNVNRPTLEDFEDMTNRIRFALQQTEVDLNAVGLYAKWLFINTNRTQSEKSNAFLSRHIPELESALKQCYSPRADFYLQKMRTHLSAELQQFSETRATLQKLIGLLDEHPGLHNASRSYDPYYQLGIVELQLSNFDDSIAAFQRIVDAHKPGSRNRYRTLTMMLYPVIGKGDLDHAEQIVAELESMPEPNALYADARFISLYLYLKSCYLYLKGQLAETWHTIQLAIDHGFEKEGMVVGLKIFEIMVLVERDMTDIASQKVESLRKHTARYGSDERSKVIFKMLLGQEKKDFQFQPFKTEAALLAELEQEHPWTIGGHEVIRFEPWYRKQCRKHKREV